MDPFSHQWRPIPRILNQALAQGFLPGRQQSNPIITGSLWDALKELTELRELTIDFDNCDPLLYERCQLPPFTNYKPRRDGLIGFTKLKTLDLRGIGSDTTTDGRFREIARVIADCVYSGYLECFSLTIERWWYYYIENTRLNDAKGLWDWCRDLWDRCFVRAEARREKTRKPTLRIVVTINMLYVSWKFSTHIDYTLRSENLVQLKILSGYIHEHTVRHLDLLAKMDLPSLRVLFLKCFLTDAHKLLGSFTGLRELYIINPGPVERFRAAQGGAEVLRNHAIAEGEIRPDTEKCNWIMDTIVKRHLRTLEVLVIDQNIPVPRSWSFQASLSVKVEEIPIPHNWQASVPHTWRSSSAFINSLALWKERGSNLKELGLMLWGPWDRIDEFLTCFPSLKCFHLFNPPSYHNGVAPIPGMPRAYQLSLADIFGHSPYFCDSSNTAFKISYVWAREILGGATPPKGQVWKHESNRWIGVGPWYIRKDFGKKWMWEDDKAMEYTNYTYRPMFYGDHGFHRHGLPGTPWKECSRMWKELEPFAL
jgi:hypothetical protein